MALSIRGVFNIEPNKMSQAQAIHAGGIIARNRLRWNRRNEPTKSIKPYKITQHEYPDGTKEINYDVN